LDMKNGYWNSGAHKDSVDLLSFSTPWGTFSYQVVPQGLISSAAWFQHWTGCRGFRLHGTVLRPYHRCSLIRVYVISLGDIKTETADSVSRIAPPTAL
jgi:hypothetical protein